MTADKALATISDRETSIAADAPDMANRVVARFKKDCTPEQALEIAKLALVHDLNPFLDELIPYQGRPYVTTTGYIRIAERHPAYEGFRTYAATEDERRAYMVTDKESLWRCEVYRTDRRVPIVAWGRAGGAYDNSQPVARARVPEMAENRSIRRALRAAFPVPIPGQHEMATGAQLKAIHAIDREQGVTESERHHTIREVFGAETSNELTTAQASAYIDGRRVNPQTGEIDVLPGITNEQVDLIWSLAGDAGVETETIRSFALEAFGHPVDRLTYDEADELIVGLREQITTVAEEQDDADNSETPQDDADSIPEFPNIHNATMFWHHARKMNYDVGDVLRVTGVDLREADSDKVNWQDLFQQVLDDHNQSG